MLRPCYATIIRMNLYGFVTIPAKYLSYALLLLDLLQGGVPVVMEGLTGIISAHAFHYLTEVYPLANPGSKRILDTPIWFRRLLGENVPTSGGSGGAAPRRERTTGGVTRIEPVRRAPPTAGGATATAASGRNWGSGRRLGD
jgi:Derlin-2/3